MAKVTIDDLRYRAEFQKPARQSDGRGGWKSATYLPYQTLWASIKAQTKQHDREKENAEQQQTKMTFILTIRYRSDISSDMRVVIGERKLHIVKTPYDPDGRRRWLSMECEERND